MISERDRPDPDARARAEVSAAKSRRAGERIPCSINDIERDVATRRRGPTRETDLPPEYPAVFQSVISEAKTLARFPATASSTTAPRLACRR